MEDMNGWVGAYGEGRCNGELWVPGENDKEALVDVLRMDDVGGKLLNNTKNIHIKVLPV